MTTIRTDALNWWKSMSYNRQEAIFNLWKIITTSQQYEFPNVMIRLSDSLIERIYREYIMRENFKN